VVRSVDTVLGSSVVVSAPIVVVFGNIVDVVEFATGVVVSVSVIFVLFDDSVVLFSAVGVDVLVIAVTWVDIEADTVGVVAVLVVVVVDVGGAVEFCVVELDSLVVVGVTLEDWAGVAVEGGTGVVVVSSVIVVIDDGVIVDRLIVVRVEVETEPGV